MMERRLCTAIFELSNIPSADDTRNEREREREREREMFIPFYKQLHLREPCFITLALSNIRSLSSFQKR